MFSVLLCLLFQLTGPGQQPDYDLRSLRWDMTIKEVMAAEHSKPYLKSDSSLQYRRRWFSRFPASLKLAFVKNQLAGAIYILTERHIRAQQHWDDYQVLVKTMTERYGEPSGDYWSWSNPLYKDRPERYGDAVLLGHLGRSNIWETARSVITLEMTGKSTEGIYTVISYAKKDDLPN